MIDDFCQSHGFKEKHRPGPAASLSYSEVVTLAVFGQWAQFPSERAFYRYALSHLRTAFPLAGRRVPHALDGFQARLAAKVALHNFCLWLNVQLGREPLAFADLLDW
jgi:hypothetical protein